MMPANSSPPRREGPVRKLRDQEQPFRGSPEDLVSRRVPVRIVDELEVIYIQDEKPRGPCGRRGQIPLQGIPETDPRAQSRKPVPAAARGLLLRGGACRQDAQARPGLLGQEVTTAQLEGAGRAGGGQSRQNARLLCRVLGDNKNGKDTEDLRQAVQQFISTREGRRVDQGGRGSGRGSVDGVIPSLPGKFKDNGRGATAPGGQLPLQFGYPFFRGQAGQVLGGLFVFHPALLDISK